MISLVDVFGIDRNLFDKSGALDPILGIDTRLFIDPTLLRVTSTPELTDSYQKVVAHFQDVLKVVSHIQQPGDRMWRQADSLLTFPEIKGLCIGYSSKSTSGSGMGPGLRQHLLTSISEIVKAGVCDPVLFELVGLFEDNVGPDRISDMVAKLIATDLIKFTQRVCSDCGIPMQEYRLQDLRVEEDLPFNPESNTPIILAPKSILRDLPIAETFADIRWIAEHNQQLRDELNAIIGSSWKQTTVSEQKMALRNCFQRHPDTLKEIIKAYQGVPPEQYDFEDDPAGEVIWYSASKDIAKSQPLSLTLGSKPTAEEVASVVEKICSHFKSLIEDNQLSKLLYDKSGVRKHESAAQLLFFGIASAYCQANELDLSPESDAGRGPVDFKVSFGLKSKVLVEVKLTSNNQLLHGYEKQLPIYQRAEQAPIGFYLVIDNGGATKGRLDTFWDTVSRTEANGPRVIWVDGIIRESASKADR